MGEVDGGGGGLYSLVDKLHITFFEINLFIYLSMTLSMSSHKSQGEFIVTCALLSLVPNDPLSRLWLPRPGIKTRSLICEFSLIIISIYVGKK